MKYIHFLIIALYIFAYISLGKYAQEIEQRELSYAIQRNACERELEEIIILIRQARNDIRPATLRRLAELGINI